METYIKKPNSIKINSFLGVRKSLSPKDHREVLQTNSNSVPLINLINRNFQGQEIGSEMYTPKSKFRFLKTVNISPSFLLEETTIEYCIPVNTRHPQKGNILIVKDGGGDGLGECCYYHYDNKDKTDSISAGVLCLDINEDKRYYVLGLLKSQHFRDFINLKTPEGSTIRHSKKVALDYNVPFPTNKNNTSPDDIQELVSLIVKNIIDKELQIIKKNKEIDEGIETEFLQNQKEDKFVFKYPSIKQIKNESIRLETSLFKEKYKKEEFKIINYINGYQKLFDLGYKISRGQNLQVSNIGESFYTSKPVKDYYKLVLSKNLTHNRTLQKLMYLGNTRKLKLINEGDIIFSCRGVDLGRVYLSPEKLEKTITNIDNMHITSNTASMDNKIFIFLYLGYLTKKQVIHSIAINGSGAPSLTQYQFEKLLIPNFPEDVQQELAEKYHNPVPKNTELTLENYFENEQNRNSSLGIYQLNKEIEELKVKLTDVIDKIIREKYIDFNLNY